jgi:hypothetical protein
MQPDQGTPYLPGSEAPPPAPPYDEESPEAQEDCGKLDCDGEINREVILEDLKRAQQNNEAEAARRKALAAKLQADVEALQTSSQDIDSVVDGYRRDYPRIRCEVGNYRCYYDQKVKEVEGLLSDEERHAIQQKIGAVDSYISDLSGTVLTLEEKDKLRLKGGFNASVQSSQIIVENKSTGPSGTNDKLKAYEALKGFHAQVLADLKKLEGWKKDIDEAIGKSDLRAAWFFLYDFGTLLTNLEERIDHYDPKTLAKALDRAWCELAQGREALRDAEAGHNDRTVTLVKTKATLEDARKNRRTRILEIIHKP